MQRAELLEQQLQEANEKLVKAVETRAELEASIQGLNQELFKAQERCQALFEANDKHTASSREASQTNADLVVQRDSLRGRLDEIECVRSDLMKQLERALTITTEQASQMHTITTKCTALEVELNAARDDKRAATLHLEEQITSLGATIDEQRALIEGLQTTHKGN